MRIASQHSRPKKAKQKNLLLFAAIVVLLLLVFLAFINRSEQTVEYFCDMESTTIDGNSFKGGYANFSGGQSKSEEQAYSGRFSAKCDPKNIYGPTLIIENINSGDIVEASVWQQSDEGFGGLVFQGTWGNYFKARNQAEKVRNGWEQIQLIDTIPLGVENGTLKVYPSVTAKSGTVYFDDIKVRHIKRQVKQSWSDDGYNGPELKLEVEERSLAKLKLKRSEAFQQGNLIAGKKDLVPARLKDQENSLDVQIRLKGDLLDHLQGKKWSFRVVPEKGKSWNGMSEFSVHNSRSRYHLLEWVFHKMLEAENILTTKYDFVQLSLNDDVLGIYAYEEHFAYPLLYRQNRERGPIIRINEDGLWQYASKGLADQMPWFESAHIEAFEGKEILQDDQLVQQFLKGQNLIYDFMQGNQRPEDLFDTDLMAKFIALLDVCMAWHAFGAINQRFYYNSALGKLEPIGYDGFTDDGHRWYQPPLIYGAKVNSRVSKRFRFRNVVQHFHYQLFNDYDFTEKYLTYLDQFTQPEYLDAFTSKHLSDIKSREKFIQREYKDFKFDQNDVFKNATAIRNILAPSTHVSIKAYRDSEGNIVLENYHQLPVEIIGFGDKTIQYRPQKRLIAEAYNSTLPVRRYTTSIKGKAKNIFCKTLGTSSIQQLPIFKWSIPTATVASQKTGIESLKDRTGISVSSSDKTVYIQSTLKTLDQDLIVPKGYQLRMSAGSTIQLKAGVSIVVYGSVFFEGTPNQPIRISADQGGQGLLILNGTEKSLIQHTQFINLGARSKNGQIVDGGLTFYESDFECNHCLFKGSKAKDALNIIRSKYLLRDTRFENSSGDAVDANLSTGKMEGITIEKTGKDAIEITGGYAELRKLNIRQAFGSSVNATRNAQVEIFDQFTVSDSDRGITASDLSNVKISKIDLSKVNQGFVVFQKLPEYGSATLTVDDFSAKEVKQLHVIDQNATVLLKNKKIEGN